MPWRMDSRDPLDIHIESIDLLESRPILLDTYKRAYAPMFDILLLVHRGRTTCMGLDNYAQYKPCHQNIQCRGHTLPF